MKGAAQVRIYLASAVARMCLAILEGMRALRTGLRGRTECS